MDKLYENIKKERLRLNMSQQELAELVGYKGKSMIAKIEKGEVDLSIDTISRFAKVLKCSELELIWGTPEEELDEETQRKSDLITGYLEQLNDEGLQEALKRLQELTELSKYKKD